MPELDGYAVLERMRADKTLDRLPVIMISAVTEIESVVRCIEIDRLLAKMQGLLARGTP